MLTDSGSREKGVFGRMLTLRLYTSMIKYFEHDSAHHFLPSNLLHLTVWCQVRQTPSYEIIVFRLGLLLVVLSVNVLESYRYIHWVTIETS